MTDPKRRTFEHKAAEGVSAKLEKRLLTYAAVAGAAGVGVLVGAQPAQADIIFTRAHTILTDGTLGLDLNHDGVTDFTLLAFTNTIASAVGEVTIGSGVRSQHASVVGVSPSNSASALKLGVHDGPIGLRQHPVQQFQRAVECPHPEERR